MFQGRDSAFDFNFFLIYSRSLKQKWLCALCASVLINITQNFAHNLGSYAARDAALLRQYNPDRRIGGALKNPFVSRSLVISEDHESLIKTRQYTHEASD